MPVDLIITGDFNPRKDFAPEHIEELARSIRRDGQWNPIILRRRPDKKYDLIAGECRLRAIKKLGLDRIKARVLSVDDEEASLLALKTNLMRLDLNAVEEAYGIKKLTDMDWSLEKVAKELDKSTTWVFYRLKLAENASEGLQNAIITQTIPLSYAFKISELPKGLQGPAVEKVVRDRLNLEETGELVRLLKAASTPEELESIFKASKEQIISQAIFRSSFSNTKGTNSNTIIECSCGKKFVIDWTSNHVISEQHHKNHSFLMKALRLLRRKE